MKTQTRYSIALSVAALYHIVEPTALLYNTLCFVLILLFGIPHGAADHRIYASIRKNANLRKYILKYVLIAIGYMLWWLLMPGKALVIFLVLSAYHFGQEFLEDLHIVSVKNWESMIWGCILLISPLLIAYSDVKPVLEAISHTALPDINIFIKIGVIAVMVSMAIAHMVYLRLKNRGSISQIVSQIQMIALITLLYTFLPFLIAFTLYFIVFHSLNAFHHQFAWLKSKITSYTLRSFLIDLSIFSVISVIGLVVFVFILQPESWTALTSYFFIVIAVLTLPHTLLFDQFYKSRRAIASAEEHKMC